MGSKISCSTCNPKPLQSGGSTAASRASHSSQSLSRRDGHVLRLWAEVFHVSASSGAVRWTQLSDDLVPITVTVVQNKYHVTAYNSRVDKVLDTWLSATRLGQASNCFVYWKDSITGDTWGLNFTSAADARAFRECISASRDFRRAESSYSLRDGGGGGKGERGRSTGRGGGGGDQGGHSGQRSAHSQPNSPSKQKYLQQMNAQQNASLALATNQCTCDCMTSDALHKQRNGRIRYSTFTRQDSSGTTQSSKSDGSLIRRQHERQQYFANRGHVRSMEDQMRAKSQREMKSTMNDKQTSQTTTRGRQEDDKQTTSVVQQLRSKSQEDVRRVATTATNTDDLHMAGAATTTTAATTTASTLSSEALKRMLRDVSVLTSSSTCSPTQEQFTSRQHALLSNDRPKSLSEVMSSMSRESMDRSRSHRSLEGRRRSLERTQCVDFTDASPPTPRHRQHDKESSLLEEYECELRRRLAAQTAQQQQLSTRDDAIDVFETLLKESMDDVASLMREVQHELTLIRAEEKRFKSLSTQSLLTSLSRSSAPILDTLSIDGQLPFCTLSGGHMSAAANHALHAAVSHSALSSSHALHPFESLSIASMVTSSEVSDDEKASLTTAISDDDDMDLRESPLRARSGTSAANFECLGSVRKSGFLSVKKWLLRKKHSLELARKRGWKGYWVCLKGTTLLFYNCESRDGHAIDAQPKHLIFVDSCLVQSIPEHPKRDHVFCLSTAFGDAYLLDAPCLLERDAWIAAIHSACAAQMARNSGKAAVAHLLTDEIARLERAIDLESRSRHETELLLSCIASDDHKQRQTLVSSVMASEEKCEKQRIEVFRYKCYLCAVEGMEEMPNPKTVLSLTNRRTKSQLNRLGVYTVSSLHAFNCAKNPSIVGSLLRRQKSEEKETTTHDNDDDRHDHLHKHVSIDVLLTTTGERRRIDVSPEWTSERLLVHLMCSHANAREYYVSHNSRVLNRNELIISDSTSRDLTQMFEIIPKVLFTIDLSRDSNDVLFGFSVESELISNDLCVYVSRVENQSIAAIHGLKRCDELVVINGALVHDLDMMFVECVLQEELTLCLMIRSTRDDNTTTATTPSVATAALSTQQMASTDDLIESLVCPPPPPTEQTLINCDQLDAMIVPKVDSFLPKSTQNSFSQLIHFQNNSNQTTERQTTTNMTTTTTTTTTMTSTTSDKTRKVVKELIDTEVTYCRSLEQLLSTYLEPLSRETTLLSQSDVRVLFGAIKDIIKNQKHFKSELESIADDVDANDRPLDVTAIANCFLAHSNNFRNYSTFCASHSRAVKLLADEKQSQSLREWLSQRSSGQLAQSLESYLIKPIQRVLKYPLLLAQMKSFCVSKESQEFIKLNEALKAMERVAEHINEMQRIHEEYGAIFEHLARSYARANTHTTVDLSPTALIHYGGVEWCNGMEFLGKNCRKGGVELHSMCFVFKQCVVFLCKETIRQNTRKGGGEKSRQQQNSGGGSGGGGGGPLTRTEVEIIRHQTLIPVIEVQVRACAQSEAEHDFRWELIQLKTNAGKRSEKIYRLSNSTCDNRNAFLRTIRQIIREDVRQMSAKKAEVVVKTTMTTTMTSRGDDDEDDHHHHRQRQMASQHDHHSHHHQQQQQAQGGDTSGDSDANTGRQQTTVVAAQQTVSCGLCGKDVSIGCRAREHSSSMASNSSESPVWKRRQDSNSSSR